MNTFEQTLEVILGHIYLEINFDQDFVEFTAF